jgi:TolB protein
MIRSGLLVAVGTACLATSVAAQDTIPVEGGVRIGITYTPGLRPGMLVLGGPHSDALDSMRAMLRRDFDYSDRFELIYLPEGDSLLLGLSAVPEGAPDPTSSSAASGSFYVNYSLYAALGADYAVGLLPSNDSATVAVTLYDVKGETERERLRMPWGDPTDGGFRMSVHRMADALVTLASGEPGSAATRVMFLSNRRLYWVDSDGEELEVVSAPEDTVFSSAWGPGASQIVYSVLAGGRGRIVVADAQTRRRRIVAPTMSELNISPAISPDGEYVAFARISEEGSDIFRYNLRRDCCLERLTVGRFSDNLSPTFSPDGRRIAFVSTRAGGTQIYVMASDGTQQELFAPFDYGVTGNSYAPDWSPDGMRIVFHRDVAGSPQLFMMDVRTRVVQQLTSAGRNEDATWAPDGRHIAFVSDRTGRRQIWVIDVETGRVRQLTRVGDARLPAWSPRIPEQD